MTTPVSGSVETRPQTAEGDTGDGDDYAHYARKEEITRAAIEGGRITAVGTGLAIPPGARVIDAAGRWVLPGFIEAHGHVGVHEEGEGWAGSEWAEPR